VAGAGLPALRKLQEGHRQPSACKGRILCQISDLLPRTTLRREGKPALNEIFRLAGKDSNIGCFPMTTET
jgi:hypothetical protein